MKLINDKVKMYLFLGLLFVAFVGSNVFWITRAAVYKKVVDDAVAQKRLAEVSHTILKKNFENLKLKNAKLNLTILLNNCNSYKIHEKVNAIPNDSLLFYADSLLTKPIPKSGKKGGSIRTAAAKLSRIPRALLGCKGEDCSQ